ncbi:hypothetical protein SAMN05444166_3435 [Singulisphaera sp. GP187]|uniref:hypothetical protein n=1 Tax=Singulisphaera sp. GP187 TaxID=1882752 RepID=UPI00092AFAC1|nr:hypothetical protein [Singulisphaera sp. GP187]SIO27922.1 hypothetical protein SAMN05444166_3435 [Singulisphaera sp. GP187]
MIDALARPMRDNLIVVLGREGQGKTDDAEKRRLSRKGSGQAVGVRLGVVGR